MKEMGFLEKRLPHSGKYKDVKYHVVWKDFTSGPPITKEMLEGKLQIGIMGDYPLILNGYASYSRNDYASYMVAFTGFNLHGSGNGIVVPASSHIYSIEDLKGKKISVPFGSAAHGMVLKAMSDMGWIEGEDLTLVSQQPAEGEASIMKGEIAGHADFCPWTELIEFRGYGRKIFDGSDAGVPYLHGVVVEKTFAETHPELVKAYLKAVLDTEEYIRSKPEELSESLEKMTGIEKEVQYLYFGPGGILTHDTTFKSQWIRALKYDAGILQKMGKIGKFDLTPWLNDSWLREVFKENGMDYEAQLKRKELINVTGWDEECEMEIIEPRMAAQIWPQGENIRGYVSPLCMMKAYNKLADSGQEVETIYTTDFETGLKLFGDKAYYVLLNKGMESTILSFATRRQAESFAKKGKGKVITFKEALSSVTD